MSQVKHLKTVCRSCHGGCGVIAHVKDGKVIKVEGDPDSPISHGSLCSKGLAITQLAYHPDRILYPMKKAGGNWERMTWDEALDRVAGKFKEAQEKYGAESILLGQGTGRDFESHFSRLGNMLGTPNMITAGHMCYLSRIAATLTTCGRHPAIDYANNPKCIVMWACNPLWTNPDEYKGVSFWRAYQKGAKLIVIDPRFTRTAAHADENVRFRPGTDVALVWGILWHIFENGWEDKEYIRQRVYGMDEIRAEVAKWTPDVVENVTGVPEAEVKLAAQTMAENRPGTIVWCMGGTQHTIGNNNTRAYCAMQLALGNIGKSGGGANIFRGHDNVQGATDLGVLSHTLPGYYGIKAGSWKHWSRVWDVDYDYMVGRFESKDMMQKSGMPVSRWIDGVLEDKANMDQPDNVRAMVLWGHAPNSQTRGPEMKKAMEKLDLKVKHVAGAHSPRLLTIDEFFKTTCDSVYALGDEVVIEDAVVTGVRYNGVFVNEQANGPYTGIWVYTGAAPGVDVEK